MTEKDPSGDAEAEIADPPKTEAKSDPPAKEAKAVGESSAKKTKKTKKAKKRKQQKESDEQSGTDAEHDKPDQAAAYGVLRGVAPSSSLAHAAAHHGHKPDRKEYWRIWGWLLALTILEVGVAYTRGHISKTAVVTALVGLALAKAVCVALFYMHLKHESKVMRWTVAFPMIFPALYAFILIAEGAYRALWGS